MPWRVEESSVREVEVKGEWRIAPRRDSRVEGKRPSVREGKWRIWVEAFGYCSRGDEMGLWDSNVLKRERDGDRVSEAAPVCSICFDSVTADGVRSTAKLKCGHEFHLDCIGSAFNAKGMMQCPNCRNIEKGNWLYGNGYRLLPAFSMDEWSYVDDLYELNYLEVPYGVHWCPVNRLGRVTSSFENVESNPPDASQEHVGHQMILTELPSNTMFAPTYHVSSDGLANTVYYHEWGQVVNPAVVSFPQNFSTGDARYHGWDHHPLAYTHHSDMSAASILASASHTITHYTRHDDGCPPITGSVYSFTDRYRSHSGPLLPDHSINRAHNIPGEHSTSHTDQRRSFSGPTIWPPPDRSLLYSYHPPATIYHNVGDTMSASDHFLQPGSAESVSRASFWNRHSSERQLTQMRSDFGPYEPTRVRSYI